MSVRVVKRVTHRRSRDHVWCKGKRKLLYLVVWWKWLHTCAVFHFYDYIVKNIYVNTTIPFLLLKPGVTKI